MKTNKEIEKEKVLEYQVNLNDDDSRRGSTRRREIHRHDDITRMKVLFPDSKSILCVGARDDSEVQSFINNQYFAKGIDICTETSLITKMDMVDLTPEFGKFDIAYCSHTLEHVVDPVKTMRAIRSVVNHGIVVILPLVDRAPDIEHPTVYEIMKYNPNTNFANFPQAYEDFAPFNPCNVRWTGYREGVTEENEVIFMIEVK